MGKSMGKLPSMDAAIRNRFRSVVEASGLDFKAASKKGGFGETYVRDVLERDRGKLDNVLRITAKIAPDFVDWVHYGRGAPPPETFEKQQQEAGNARSYTAPVMGFVGAGAQISVEEEQVPPGGYYDINTIIPLPPGAVAFEITGDSMEPRYAAGDIVVVLAKGQPVNEIPNGVEAAVLLEDGLRYLKKVWRDPNGTFTLQSHNAPPIYGARLTWVSDVWVIVPAHKWKRLANGARWTA